MTRPAGSSHSSIQQHFATENTAAACCSLVQLFGLKVSISPRFFPVVTTIVVASSALHSPIRRANVSMDSSLAERSRNTFASSILIFGVELPSPRSFGLPSGSAEICNLELVASVCPPMSGSCTLILSSSRPFYHGAIIPDPHASPGWIGFLNEVDWLVAQSISGLRVMNHGNHSTRSYAVSGTTSTSNL